MMKHRYLPFTQQPYCCVSACLQMVMHRHGIPLISQEDLAYELGLIVPESQVHLFERARTGEKPSAGWGTQIQDPEYEPNKVFKRLNIPLSYRLMTTSNFKDVAGLKELLNQIQKDDLDALLCFDYRVLWGTPNTSGHVCVFDHINGEDVWLVDPDPNVPKYRKVSVRTLFQAMDFHGFENSCGVWVISKI